jgi:hypothetical protein
MILKDQCRIALTECIKCEMSLRRLKHSLAAYSFIFVNMYDRMAKNCFNKIITQLLM